MLPISSTVLLSRRQLLLAGLAVPTFTALGQDEGSIKNDGVIGNDGATSTDTPADTAGESPDSRLSYNSPQIQNWRIGLVLETPVTCTNVLATFPVPMDWPEQKVTVVGQTIDPAVSGWEPRELPGGAKQVVCRWRECPPDQRSK